MRETERLTFRRIVDDDFETLWGFWSDDEVRAHLISRPQTREDFAPMFAGMRDYDAIWAVCEKASGAVIGRCGFYMFEGETPELAYLLGSAWWGKGLATEMGHAALNYAFETRRWPRVVALILPDNTRSLTVARKLGFAYERDVTVRERLAQLHARRR